MKIKEKANAFRSIWVACEFIFHSSFFPRKSRQSPSANRVPGTYQNFVCPLLFLMIDDALDWDPICKNWILIGQWLGISFDFIMIREFFSGNLSHCHVQRKLGEEKESITREDYYDNSFRQWNFVGVGGCCCTLMPTILAITWTLLEIIFLLIPK